jgi:hypothetical protein
MFPMGTSIYRKAQDPKGLNASIGLYQYGMPLHNVSATEDLGLVPVMLTSRMPATKREWYTE